MPHPLPLTKMLVALALAARAAAAGATGPQAAPPERPAPEATAPAASAPVPPDSSAAAPQANPPVAPAAQAPRRDAAPAPRVTSAAGRAPGSASARATTTKASSGAAPRRLDEVHIEGEVPVPQVLFITARDQRRLMDVHYRRYLRTSRELGEQTVLPSRIELHRDRPAEDRKETPR